MSAQPATIKMQDLAERKQYETDKKVLREIRAATLEHTRAVVAFAREAKSVKRTRPDAEDAAERLTRIQKTESYREEFGTGERGFAAFCRAMGYSRGHVSDLLNFRKVSKSIKPEVLAKLGEEHLSYRQARVVGRVPEAERDAFVETVAATGQTSPTEMEAMRQEIFAAPEATLSPTEAPKQVKSENFAANIKQIIARLLNAFAAEDELPFARKHIDQDALVARAEVIQARKMAGAAK